MKIVKAAIAGTLESSDAMITITPLDKDLTVEVESVVLEQFESEIERAVRDVLHAFSVEGASVRVQDQGAVECVLKARVETAVHRAGGLYRD